MLNHVAGLTPLDLYKRWGWQSVASKSSAARSAEWWWASCRRGSRHSTCDISFCQRSCSWSDWKCVEAKNWGSSRVTSPNWFRKISHGTYCTLDALSYERTLLWRFLIIIVLTRQSLLIDTLLEKYHVPKHTLWLSFCLTCDQVQSALNLYRFFLIRESSGSYTKHKYFPRFCFRFYFTKEKQLFFQSRHEKKVATVQRCYHVVMCAFVLLQGKRITQGCYQRQHWRRRAYTGCCLCVHWLERLAWDS